jgi:hypothetical protein
MTTFLKLLVTCVCLLGISNQAGAIPIGQGAFSGSENLVDFNGLTSGTSITNQYVGLGVTFSGSPFLADMFPATTINGTMSAANHNPINNPITAIFGSVQNRVGMMFGTQIEVVSTVEIEAFLGATLVDSATFVSGGLQPGGNVPTVFGGLEVAGGFDRIEFRALTGNAAFQIDDFRFESTQVPEPRAITLMCLGIAGIGFARKKRQWVS